MINQMVLTKLNTIAMEALAHKWIIYDGNCGLCLNSKKWLTRLGIIPEEKCLN